MNRKQLSLLLAIVSLVFIVTASAQKQDQKWTEWSKKDAQKVLDDSPWGQIQTDTDTSQMFYSPTSDPRTPHTVSLCSLSVTALQTPAASR